MLHAFPFLAALVPAFATEVPADPADRLARIDAMYRGYQRLGFRSVPEIAPSELDRLDRPVFVDVRTPEEQAVSMIPGAITQAAFEADPQAFAGRPIVAYCTIGARSGMFAKKLASNGFDVYNLRGSLLRWTFERGPLEHAGEPTRRVHTYGRKWAIVADGWEAVH